MSESGMREKDQSIEVNRADGRRRFLKLGALATPMIVTLCARPAHATETGGSLGVYDYANDGGMMDDGQDFRRI